MELSCSVQTYDWGKRGSKSAVALLAKANSYVEIDESKTYAELWMGDHPSGPSKIKSSNQLLSEFVRNNPEKLGKPVIDTFGPGLPYLFKVLSVERALSIQVHPSKKQAEVFFFQYPDIYKDPNHKPELAIALTNFEALCSFRPIEEILSSIQENPELVQVIGEANVDLLKKGQLKPSFQALMTSSSEKVKGTINKLLEKKNECAELQLARRLNEQYPNDVGVLCVFWLNYVTLSPGEALFLGPNEPHAYISGDCVECMANSDNVVRAGLTPKFRDVSTLCGMLTYKSFLPSEIKFKPVTEDGYTITYIPPVQDFAVARTSVSKGESYTLKALSSASIVLIIDGSGSAGTVNVTAGSVLFVAAGEIVALSAKQDITLYRAYCNV